MGVTRIEKYLRDTRTPVYTVLYVVPLFLVYEALALTLHTFQITTLRNGADVMLRNMAAVFGLNNFPMIVFAILLVLAIVAGYYKKKHSIQVSGGFFILMFLESILYAVMMGAIALNATNFFLNIPQTFALSISLSSTDFWVNIMLSFGAGIHEEFFFRFVLISALLEASRHILKGTRGSGILSWNAVFALILSSVIFSCFHYVGEYGDVFRLDSFIFRMISGLYLSLIYLLRGFGVSAWTHALYDVFLLTGFLE